MVQGLSSPAFLPPAGTRSATVRRRGPQVFVDGDSSSRSSIQRWTRRQRARDGLMGFVLDCLIFKGAKSDGYGSKWRKGRMWPAHRLAWLDAGRQIPDGFVLCHKCDNRLCVNLDHLFLGTPGDNNRDRARKGRSVAGERHPRAKLSLTDVGNIRRAITAGESLRSIARRYGMDWTTIRAIRDERSWACPSSFSELNRNNHTNCRDAQRLDREA